MASLPQRQPWPLAGHPAGPLAASRPLNDSCRLELDSSVTKPSGKSRPLQRKTGSSCDARGITQAPEMEYYYCPGLLKFLRYLWVSVAGQTGVFFFFSSLLPSLLFGSARLAASLFSFSNGGRSEKEGALGKGMGACRGAWSPDSVGIGGSRVVTSGLRKTRKTRAVLVSFPESDVSLI